MKNRYVLLFIALIFSVTSLHAKPDKNKTVIEGAAGFLVKYVSDAAVTELPSFDIGIDTVEPLVKQGVAQSSSLGHWYKVTVESGFLMSEVLYNLESQPGVEAVIPDFKMNVKPLEVSKADLNADKAVAVESPSLPNDPLFNQQWALKNTGQDGGTAGVDINAEAAWSIRTDASNITVAIIDTGINESHPDLAPNLWVNPGEIPGNAIDDDLNGYVDDVHGYNMFGENNDLTDLSYGGSLYAGVVGAKGNNGIGISGVAWDVKLMILKVHSGAFVFMSDFVESFAYAIDNGASVILLPRELSHSMFPWPPFGIALKDMIDAANSANILVVTDSDYSADNYPQYPSAFASPNVIAGTGLTNKNEAVADAYYTRKAVLDVAAPSIGVLTTNYDLADPYIMVNNEGVAAAHIAGVAALIYAEHPGISAGEVREQLLLNVDPVPGYVGVISTEGRINAAGALILPEADECTEYTSSVAQHITAGRAYACGFFNMYGCAVGSGTQIGFRYVSTPVKLAETSPGYFILGGCPASVPATENYPPVIDLNGESSEFILVGQSYLDPGATAADREDGNLTSQIVKTGSVNTNVVGTYYLSYQVTDSDGQVSAIEYRAINVMDAEMADWQPQVILYYDKLTFEPVTIVPLYTVYQEPGYLGWDLFDGDITDQVTVTGIYNVAAPGDYYLTYNVINSRGIEAYSKQVRPVLVLGDGPQIYFRDGIKSETLYVGQTFYSPWIRAYDLVDGELDDEVVESGVVNTSVPGVYLLTYSVTDSDGYSDSMLYTVNVLADTVAPVINLLGDTEMTLEVGDSFVDPGATAEDNVDGDISGLIVVTGSVNTSVSGDYVLRYNVSDSSGNPAVEKTRVVHVIAPPSCVEYSGTPQQHVTAGRAYRCGFFNLYACAVGSGTQIGYYYSYVSVILNEDPEGSGYYNVGACPP